MRKVTIGLLIGLLALSMLLVGVVSAQSPTPQAGACPGFVDKDGDGVCDLAGAQGRGGMMGGRFGGGRWGGQSFIATVADELDLTVAQVAAELGEDVTLRQVIANHGGDAEAIVDAFLAARSEVLQQAVTAGKLTQEQADLMLDRMEEQVTARLDQAGIPSGRGGMMGRGRGGMMRRGGAFQSGQGQSSQTPAARSF